MNIVVGSDHAGFALKAELVSWLKAAGHQVDDKGPASADRVDYPDFAHQVASAVGQGTADAGVLVCGSGIGMAMAANRHSKVRAANCTNEYQAEMTRRHNDANVLCLGERVVGPGMAQSIVQVFFNTAFEGGRHAARIEKIETIETIEKVAR